MGLTNQCLVLLYIAITVVLKSTWCQYVPRKPWPMYSLQNMPHTKFTCHDKIIGGYYADAETQCQMFHVCVKVAGFGVQDFRFLCPNGTAFDQEAQICADWGDVDCEQAVLYYGSDNFDLYRIGSNYESKRAPLAEEEESTFHLQRAETSDFRRSKETIIDQKSRPHQPPNYSARFEKIAVHPTDSSNFEKKTKLKPLDNSNFFSSTTTAPHTTQKTTKIPYYNQSPINTFYSTAKSNQISNYDSKNDADDIFKGSHSSNFFSNRNHGKEDDFDDFSKQPIAETTKRTVVRGRRIKNHNRVASSNQIPTSSTKRATTTTTTTTTTTARPRNPNTQPKKLTLQSSFRTGEINFYTDYSSTSPRTTTTTTTITTLAPTSSVHRFNINPFENDAAIRPTTYNPFKFQNRPNSIGSTKPDNVDSAIAFQAKTTKKPVEPRRLNTALSVHHQEYLNKQANTAPIEPQFFRNKETQNQKSFQPPAPFVAPNVNAQRSEFVKQNQTRKSNVIDFKISSFDNAPRGFSSRGQVKHTNQDVSATTERIGTTLNDEYIEIRKESTYRQRENSVQSSTPAKKFSTLVPRDQYYPTTFKPTTYRKELEKTTTTTTTRRATFATTTTTTARPTTFTTHSSKTTEADEDDGQYHPELYEQDFPRNQKKFKHRTQTNSKRFETSTDLSDEDELFKTAHSLNLGTAGLNKIRSDKIKANHETSPKSSGQQFFYAPTTTTTTTAATVANVKKSKSKPKKASNKKRPHADEDASYDYAYYDTLSETPQEYSEYDIAEFSKTKKQK